MLDRHLKFGPATLLLASCVLVACGRAPQPSVDSQPAPARSQYVASATIQELMDAVIDPAADRLWNAVSIRTDSSGTHETRPSTPEEWHELRRAAMVIVESANLLSVPGRRVATGSKTLEAQEDLDLPAIQQRLDTRHDELAQLAGAMREIGGQLVVAADRQDVEAFTELGGTLDTVCEACHRAFWYPEQPPIDST